jgi:hypothetical protein
VYPSPLTVVHCKHGLGSLPSGKQHRWLLSSSCSEPAFHRDAARHQRELLCAASTVLCSPMDFDRCEERGVGQVWTGQIAQRSMETLLHSLLSTLLS